MRHGGINFLLEVVEVGVCPRELGKYQSGIILLVFNRLVNFTEEQDKLQLVLLELVSGGC